MSYRLHPQDRGTLAQKMADLLRGVPMHETQGLILEADKLLLDREFGDPNLVRNCDKTDPYWFEHSLIRTADKLLQEGRPVHAWHECLNCHNHGHSGFVGQVGRVYQRPHKGGEEEAISEEIRGMILKITAALLDSNPLAKEGGVLGDGWLTMVAANECLVLLGADVPKMYVDRFRDLLREYEEARPTEKELPQVKAAFRHRFLR